VTTTDHSKQVPNGWKNRWNPSRILKLGKNGKTNNMGKLSILTRLRLWIGSIGWRMFIWGVDTTEEKYWDDIYELEKLRREQKEEEE
jgi:hypothetical protein